MTTKAELFLTALLALPVTLPATEAVQNVDASYAGFAYQEVGFLFKPATNITINSLGFASTASTNLTESVSYVVQVLNAAGDPLTSVTLTVTNTLSSQFRYTSISPLNLGSGSTNYLTCYDANQFASNAIKFWVGSIITEEEPGGGTFDVAADIEYLGATTSTNLYGGTNAPKFLFVGPNFDFTVTPAALQPSELTISLTSSNTVKLSWPATDTLGQLQTAPDFNIPMSNVTTIPVIMGSSRVVELPPADSQRYFRLRYP